MKTRWRMAGNFGLKRKAMVIFLLFVILPTIGVGVIVQYKYNKVLREQFISATRRNLDNVTSQLGEQTKMVEDIADYLILSPDMRNFLRSYPLLEAEQRSVYKRNIEDFLTFQLMSRSYIRTIEISGYNGNTIEMGEPFSGDEGRWQREAVARKGGILWTEGYPLNSSWNGQVRVLSMVRILNSFSEITKPLGMLTIRLDEAEIAAQLEKVCWQPATAACSSWAGQVISSWNPSTVCRTAMFQTRLSCRSSQRAAASWPPLTSEASAIWLCLTKLKILTGKWSLSSPKRRWRRNSAASRL